MSQYTSDLYTKYDMPDAAEINAATLQTIGALEKKIKENYELSERALREGTSVQVLAYVSQSQKSMTLVQKKNVI